MLAETLEVDGAAPALDMPLESAADVRLDASVLRDHSTVAAALPGPVEVGWTGGAPQVVRVQLGDV